MSRQHEFGTLLEGLPTGMRCDVVEGQDLKQALAALNRASLFTQFESDGEPYAVTSRILMPDEEADAMCGAPA